MEISFWTILREHVSNFLIHIHPPTHKKKIKSSGFCKWEEDKKGKQRVRFFLFFSLWSVIPLNNIVGLK